MPYEILSHKADIGIKGISNKSFEEAFSEAAKAMFSIMYNIEKLKTMENVKDVETTIEITADNLEELFVYFLNELLYESYDKNAIFYEFDVKIEFVEHSYLLMCKAKGKERIENFELLGTEVKAATFTGLKVEKENGKYVAQCILDV